MSASTQNQALNALVFLLREVLGVDPGAFAGVVRAARRRLPVVLTRGEVRDLLAHLPGTPGLVGRVQYGGGLRLLECLRLRVKDVDFAAGQVVVRDGNGGKDRRTVLRGRCGGRWRPTSSGCGTSTPPTWRPGAERCGCRGRWG